VLRVRIGPGIHGDQQEFASLIRLGFAGCDVDPATVEVHVRAWWLANDDPLNWFRGVTYEGVPVIRWPVSWTPANTGLAAHLARVDPRTRWLVRMKIPHRPDAITGYPRSWRLVAGAPWLTVHCWREHLLSLAGHEASHVRQLQHGAPCCEADAERDAAQVLRRWRAQSAWRSAGAVGSAEVIP
jgi:hypothetical protein